MICNYTPRFGLLVHTSFTTSSYAGKPYAGGGETGVVRRCGYVVDDGSVLARDNAEYLEGGTRYSTISWDILCCSFGVTDSSSKIWCIVEHGSVCCTVESADDVFLSVGSSSKDTELNWSSGI